MWVCFYTDPGPRGMLDPRSIERELLFRAENKKNGWLWLPMFPIEFDRVRALAKKLSRFSHVDTIARPASIRASIYYKERAQAVAPVKIVDLLTPVMGWPNSKAEVIHLNKPKNRKRAAPIELHLKRVARSD